MGFTVGSAGKESACDAGDVSSIPGLGRSPGEGNGYPLQYSGLEDWVAECNLLYPCTLAPMTFYTSLYRVINNVISF